MPDVISTVKKDYITDLIKQGKRVDGRAPDQYREISVEKGIIQNAQGSSRVKIGDTQVLVGVKIEHAEPFPDTPEEGILMVNAELVPLASPTFESGRPSEDAVELARVVDRGIRESNTIDLEKLGITPGEDVWAVFIDIHVLDHDGNLIDASALGALAALYNTKPPNDQVWKLSEFPVLKKPVAVTIAKVNGKLVVDPCLDEERVMDARITMTTAEDGSICAIQKGGIGCFSKEELLQARQLALAKAPEIREKVRL
jgi:exosome complex component RRP42